MRLLETMPLLGGAQAEMTADRCPEQVYVIEDGFAPLHENPPIERCVLPASHEGGCRFDIKNAPASGHLVPVARNRP